MEKREKKQQLQISKVQFRFSTREQYIEQQNFICFHQDYKTGESLENC